MPVDESDHELPPSPLRRNDFVDMPNPWTRVEVCRTILQRLALLSAMAMEMDRSADRAGLAAVLLALTNDLRLSLWGTLVDCEELLQRGELTDWAVEATAIVWPTPASPATRRPQAVQHLVDEVAGDGPSPAKAAAIVAQAEAGRGQTAAGGEL